MSKKKIVIIANTSWFVLNFKSGLIKSLQDLGHDVIVVAPKDEYSNILEKMGCLFYDIYINNKGTNPLEDLLLIYRFYKLFLKIKPDILLLHTIKPNLYASFAGRISSVPVINTITGLGTVFLNDNFSSKIARFLYSISLKSSKKVFFENPDDRQLFIDKKLVSSKKTDIIAGSGINTDVYKPFEENIQNQNLTFMMIARLVKDKGIIEYIEAIKIIKEKYPNIVFKLLGTLYPGNPTAVSEDELNSWIDEGLINYLGHSDDVMSEILKVDCVVLPSYREGLSRVLLEAGSLAKPIITTNTPGCKDVVDDGINGFLCEVKNSADLAVQMEKMINLSQDQRVHMGMKSRKKIINEFDEQLVIKKYLKNIK